MAQSGSRSDGHSNSIQKDDVDDKYAALSTSLLTMHAVLQQILTTIQRSTTIPPEVTDQRLRFWTTYQRIAEEFDAEFLRQYDGAMDASMIFAGLFSAVCATFAVLMQPALNPDPNVTTQALLQAIILTINGTSLPTPIIPPWDGPSTTTIWVQCLLYASLSCSLFAALGAVLGKQWLNHYSRVGERGTVEERGMDRHRKFVNLDTYRFRAVLEVLPVLLQTSLFLFGLALSAFIWDNQHTIGVILIVANGAGALFYFYAISSSVLDPQSPFYTPISFIRYIPAFQILVRAVATTYTVIFQKTWRALHRVQSFISMQAFETRTDEEAPELELVTLDQKISPAALQPDVIASRAVAWVLETSTDPIAVLHALHFATELRWPAEDIARLSSQIIDRSLTGLISCVRRTGNDGFEITDSSRQRAILYCSSFLFFYWEKLALDPIGFETWSRGTGQAFVEDHAGWVSEFMVTSSIGEPSSLLVSYDSEEEESTFGLVHLTFSHLRSGRTVAAGDRSSVPSHTRTARVGLLRVGMFDSTAAMLRSHIVLNLAQTVFLPTDRGSSFNPNMVHIVVHLVQCTQSSSLLGMCVLALGIFMRRWGEQTGLEVLPGLGEVLNNSSFEVGPAVEYSFGCADFLLQKFSSWSKVEDSGDAILLLSRFIDVLHILIDKGHKSALRGARLPPRCLNLCALLHPFTSPISVLSSPILDLASRILEVGITCAEEPCAPDDLTDDTPLFLQNYQWGEASSDQDVVRLVDLLTMLHRDLATGRQLSKVQKTTAHIFLIIASSDLTNLSAHLKNPGLLRALDWALHNPVTGPWSPSSSTADPLFLLHCATETLIHACLWLTEHSLLDDYALLTNNIPDFAEAWCAVATELGASSKNAGLNWDTEFVNVVHVLAGYTPDGMWLAKPENEIYARHCVDAVERDLVQRRNRRASGRVLLACTRLFDVDEPDPYWHSPRVQLAALVALELGWWVRTPAPDLTWLVFSEEVLCERTAQFLMSHFWRSSDPLLRQYRWVADALLEDLQVCLEESNSERLRELMGQVRDELEELKRP